MNSPYPHRQPPGPRRDRRLPERYRRRDLATRIGRARLVYLLGRGSTPLGDWLPLGLACAALGQLLGVPGLPAS